MTMTLVAASLVGNLLGLLGSQYYTFVGDDLLLVAGGGSVCLTCLALAVGLGPSLGRNALRSSTWRSLTRSSVTFQALAVAGGALLVVAPFLSLTWGRPVSAYGVAAMIIQAALGTGAVILVVLTRVKEAPGVSWVLALIGSFTGGLALTGWTVGVAGLSEAGIVAILTGDIDGISGSLALGGSLVGATAVLVGGLTSRVGSSSAEPEGFYSGRPANG
jgi:hypothetical protein